MTTTDAHRRYAAWYRENGMDPVGQREFTNTLKDEDIGYKTGVRIDGRPTTDDTASPRSGVEQDVNLQLTTYMRGDTFAGGTTGLAGGIDHYIYSYYEDIELHYRKRIYNLGV